MKSCFVTGGKSSFWVFENLHFFGKTKVCVVVEARAAPVLTIELKLTSVHGIHKWPKMDNKSTISSSVSKSCIQIIAPQRPNPAIKQ